ncbi:MAG: putative toxin-antitoxin system toxin component, PIN family [Bryobacteraceae bacterium]
MRVVLDTNILISACWTPGGLESQTVDLVLAGTLTACVTPEIWAEYREVLFRDKFAALRVRVDELLLQLEAKAFRVKPIGTVNAARDEDDNRFLECAEAAGAAYLITGNLRHFPPRWGATAIVNARQFLTSLQE